MSIKAIETVWNGYRFRSRLEARWAVYFSSIKIKWEYENEGYELPSGRYLPDFWLPEVRLWAEVKTDNESLDETKIKELVQTAHDEKHPSQGILLLIGTPAYKTYDVVSWASSGEPYLLPHVLSNYHDYPKTESRFYCVPADDELESDAFDDAKLAVYRARSARFEYGESPIV